MNNVKKAVADNKKKMEHLESYLLLNEIAMERMAESNISAVNELINKKKSLINTINLLDDRIIQDIEGIKSLYQVDDLGELKASEYPELLELKEIAVVVLRKMVDAKSSDEALFEKIDLVFEDYKNERGRFDKSKLELFTKSFFENKIK